MVIKSAEFITSTPTLATCPLATFPEYAFVGRSNVGKSSLINMLVNRKGLAKTSSTPGKTQTINYFLINSAWYLVDLPGLGFAKVSKKLRENWEENFREYILNRRNLMTVFVLVDSRLMPQRIDVDLINWLGEHDIPQVIVFTKCDKQSKQVTEKMISIFEKELLQYWDAAPTFIRSSSQSQMGRDEILNYLESINQIYKPIS